MERDTAQRRAIRGVLTAAGRPLTPREVLNEARRHVPNIGIATVYRTVKALIEEGWLSPVELPGQPQRYERAGKDHHHHFNCNQCGRTFEMDGCPGGLDLIVPEGFKMEAHEVFIYGLCEECNVIS